MNRREFLKVIGAAGAGAMIIPVGLQIIPQHYDHVMRIGDCIVFPGPDISGTWGMFAVIELLDDGRMGVIPMLAGEPKIRPERKGDVFLHVYTQAREKMDLMNTGYAHLEEEMTHFLYELDEDPIVDHSRYEYIFKYKPSNEKA